jgi:hypothetical protein
MLAWCLTPGLAAFFDLEMKRFEETLPASPEIATNRRLELAECKAFS